MATAATVFFKSLLKTASEYCFYIRPSVVNYFSALPDTKNVTLGQWRDLVSDVVKGFALQAELEPSRAVAFFTDVTRTLTPEVLLKYRTLTLKLFEPENMFKVWSHARDDDELYAFAYFFMTYSVHIVDVAGLSDVISAVLNKKFVLSEDASTWREDFMLAAFGPAWYALYAKDRMGDVDFMELILEQKPPILGRPSDALAVSLPGELGMFE